MIVRRRTTLYFKGGGKTLALKDSDMLELCLLIPDAEIAIVHIHEEIQSDADGKISLQDILKDFKNSC